MGHWQWEWDTGSRNETLTVGMGHWQWEWDTGSGNGTLAVEMGHWPWKWDTGSGNGRYMGLELPIYATSEQTSGKGDERFLLPKQKKSQ